MTGAPLIYRLAIPVLALCLFAVFASLWAFAAAPTYVSALSFFGISAGPIPFVDMHAVLAAAECSRQGLDVYVSNPCDILQRTHTYSPLWLTITPASWGTKDTLLCGLILDLLFILSWTLVIIPRSLGAALVFAFAALSPTTAFVLERANIDIIIFLLVVGAGVLFLAPLRYRLFSYAVFLVAGLLKYYPLVLLVLVVRERWRHAFALAGFALAILLAFGFRFRADLSNMVAVIPQAPYFTVAFAARNLPYGIAELMPNNALLSHAAIAVSLLGILLAVAAARISRNLRLLTSTSLDLSRREASWLVIGSLLLTACFFAGPNINYRGIFFLLVLPGLVSLRQSADSPTSKRWLGGMIAATLFLLWEEFFRHALYAALDDSPNEWLRHQVPLFFWLGRELLWWWLITGLASIGIGYLWRMPLIQDGVARLRRLAALSFKLS